MLKLLMLGGSLVVVLAACAHDPGTTVYGRRDVQKAWSIREATIGDIREVEIEGRRTAIGRIGGGLIGYELGRSIGSGSGSRIAGAAGAVAGAVAGEAAEEALTRERGFEILVELEDGRSLVIVQPADQNFAVGAKVRVYTRGNGEARVAKL